MKVSRMVSRTGGALPALLLLLIAATSGCAARIGREELLKQIEAGHPPLIIDVRSDAEYDRDHVPGAVHIPFYSVYGERTEIEPPDERPIVVYCEHGPRAGIASFALWAAGFDSVYLDGHMKAWRKAGLPMQSGAKPAGG